MAYMVKVILVIWLGLGTLTDGVEKAYGAKKSCLEVS
jgi:hypothetical protein